jgi:caffeoyl-CoA O-methyltransferase
MLSLIGERLETYVHDHTTPEAPLFVDLRAETHATLIDPQMQVGRVEGRFLAMMVAVTRAQRVIEVGTYSGYSALAMASALPSTGRLVTCDIDPLATEVARRYFARAPWGDRIDLRLGPALETLGALAQEGATFDLAFIDADKENYAAYWDAILPMLVPGGVVLADNTLWSGKVLDPQTTSDHAIVAFNEHVRRDSRVDHVLLSIRDGVMFARKR